MGSGLKSKTESKPGGNALSQMVAAGHIMRQSIGDELKDLRIENEQLKATISIMKEEMDQIV